MNDIQRDLLLKAQSTIAAAKLLLANSYPDHAASRAYYAMFYIAEAFLECEGLTFSKHSAVISCFGKEFSRTGRVPVEYHHYLIDAQELRHIADYGPRTYVEPELAAEYIERAKLFLDLAQEMIGQIPEE